MKNLLVEYHVPNYQQWNRSPVRHRQQCSQKIARKTNQLVTRIERKFQHFVKSMQNCSIFCLLLQKFVKLSLQTQWHCKFLAKLILINHLTILKRVKIWWIRCFMIVTDNLLHSGREIGDKVNDVSMGIISRLFLVICLIFSTQNPPFLIVIEKCKEMLQKEKKRKRNGIWTSLKLESFTRVEWTMVMENL